jgi:hypothetical protein
VRTGEGSPTADADVPIPVRPPAPRSPRRFLKPIAGAVTAAGLALAFVSLAREDYLATAPEDRAAVDHSVLAANDEGHAIPGEPGATSTSFGTVAVVGFSRLADARSAPPGAHEGHAQGAAAPATEVTAGSSTEPIETRPWSTTVRVVVTVHNQLDQPVLFSPGQFRLGIDGTAGTVAPLDAGRVSGALAPGTAVRTWVRFLAPEQTGALRLEFADVGRGRTISIDLGSPAAARPPAGHGHAEGH